jgi:hypothetical protein
MDGGQHQLQDDAEQGRRLMVERVDALGDALPDLGDGGVATASRRDQAHLVPREVDLLDRA